MGINKYLDIMQFMKFQILNTDTHTKHTYKHKTQTQTQY
jgi:hypothetical protein